MSTLKKICLAVVLGLLMSPSLKAQNVNDALSFGNQAVHFGDQQGVVNPVTGIMPGTAFGAGFGSYLDNPASAALFDESFGELGITLNTVNENAAYLGNSRMLDNNQFHFSNIGLVYKFPTAQGTFVIGGGYNQHTSYNRALGFNSRNENSTITDQFKVPGNTYQDIAFNTYATDFGGEDWDESILRTGFDNPGDFLGIQQQGEIFESGYAGEYSAFFATEFQRNLMIGASIGLLVGSYEYDRLFQEIDEFNDYNSDFIDSSGDGAGDTDFDNLILSDQINSEYTGFRGRIGAIYTVRPGINIGASYTMPTRILVDEQFDATISNTFDNSVMFDDSTEGEFSYSVKYPSRIGLGFALDDLGRLSLSVSGDYVDYSNTSIDFEDDTLFEDQQFENDFISENFAAVWNFRSGAALQINPALTLRGGFAYIPSKFVDGNDDRSQFSAGAGFAISQNTTFEVGAQYLTWDEESVVYTYGDLDYSTLPDSAPPVDIQSEDAIRTIDQFQVMGTIRFRLQ
ncbi:MAG: outer membrane protein transport protein [Balneolaceae bacterium]